jgi:hypothetical protein
VFSALRRARIHFSKAQINKIVAPWPHELRCYCLKRRGWREREKDGRRGSPGGKAKPAIKTSKGKTARKLVFALNRLIDEMDHISRSLPPFRPLPIRGECVYTNLTIETWLGLRLMPSAFSSIAFSRPSVRIFLKHIFMALARSRGIFKLEIDRRYCISI